MRIPKEVKSIIEKLQKAGFEAYIVGGCVRDLLLALSEVEGVGEKHTRSTGSGLALSAPKDWDITTNAKPEEIQKLFPKSFYENAFFTVGVQTESKDPSLKVVEITTYRSEAKYTDKRHPDQVTLAKTLEEDLKRRDFTVNAMAIQIQNAKCKSQNDKSKFKIIDPFHGQEDLEAKLIRTVGDPEERFSEDALRMMRAVRFAVSLGPGWKIEEETAEAVAKNAHLLRAISKERVRDELEKIIMADRAAEGIELLRQLGLLKYILPELEEGVGVAQNKHHKYTVWEHNVLSLRYAVEKNWGFEVRMASLLHDIAKPRTKRGEGPDCTFYGHQVVGARMAMAALSRLKFPKETTEKVASLIANHMFVYDPDPKIVSDSSVRRLVAKVGPENMEELIQLRIADRIGSGVPKAEPYRLRHFRFRVEKILAHPISRKVMAVNGNDLIKEIGMEPGPRLGAVLDLLFEEILEDPKRNNKEYLLDKAYKLTKLDGVALKNLRRKAQDRYQGLLQEEEEQLKRKYYVE